MINFYYIYAALWAIILFLYSLGWSGLNDPLNPILIVFFSITILLSFVLGRRFSNRYKYDFRHIPAPLPSWYAILIAACSVIWLLQLGFVPFFGYFDGSYDYEEMINLDASIFMTVGIVGSCFGSCYQFSRLLERRTRRDLLLTIMFVGILLLVGSRGPLVVCAIVLGVLFLSRNVKVVTLRNALLSLLIVLAALWLFGVVGNIRSGYDWNDSSYIYLLGKYRGFWPDILPKEFCWAYSYLTSPLANLNHQLSVPSEINVVNFAYDFLPMLLSKRLPLYEPIRLSLVVSYFNVSSVWGNYYGHLSVLGLFLGFVIQMLILEFSVHVSNATPYSNIMKAFCAEVAIMSFFVNSLVYPYMGYPLIMVLLISLWHTQMEKMRQYRRIGNGV